MSEHASRQLPELFQKDRALVDALLTRANTSLEALDTMPDEEAIELLCGLLAVAPEQLSDEEVGILVLLSSQFPLRLRLENVS